ncbi:hypothetical protein HYC85_032055 [Camellia sinensis]|uniref:Nicalin n=1 Tax=Camellia sinensis TaxID=4442 RepID=A0A7J7FSA0_CAMSI|nr:hypothetical protein HYC85_032055 [Camellia sinensis]
MAAILKKPREGEVLESVYSVIALLFILVACVDLCDAVAVVDVYRLIQYDLAGVPFGSRLASLNHHAGSSILTPAADLSRTVILIPVREMNNITLIREYIGQRRPLGGLIFLLPWMFSPENKDNMDGEMILYPVYFAFEDDNINAVLADVKMNDATGQPATATAGGYKLVVSAPEPRKLASPTITNIQGWLPGLKADGDSNQLPTIAIVASYDTFGAAPALSVGSDSTGSGVVVLLEIARTRGRYNLLFGLTSGGPYNYNGTHKWLRSFDQRLRESIDYAICLNSIGSWDNELWIHVSKPPENAYIKQIFEGFSNVAEDLGLKVGLKHKKINISNPRVAWEHEQFSRLRVTAATLSGLSVAPELLESTGGLFDNRHLLNEAAIMRSVKLVSESLARHIYGHQGKNINIFADNSTLTVNPSYVASWLDLLSRTPRVAPFLTKNDPLIMALKKELADHTVDVNLHHEVLDGMFTLYDSTSARLSIYQVASVTFDLLLLLVLGSYLIVLFSFLVITTRGLDDLISLFRRPPSRKNFVLMRRIVLRCIWLEDLRRDLERKRENFTHLFPFLFQISPQISQPNTTLVFDLRKMFRYFYFARVITIAAQKNFVTSLSNVILLPVNMEKCFKVMDLPYLLATGPLFVDGMPFCKRVICENTEIRDKRIRDKSPRMEEDFSLAFTDAYNELMAWLLILSCCYYTCCIRRKLHKMLNITFCNLNYIFYKPSIRPNRQGKSAIIYQPNRRIWNKKSVDIR